MKIGPARRKAAVGLVRAGALAAAFALAGGAIPLLGVAVTLFTPIPVMVYAVGREAGRWRALGAVALATALIAIFRDPQTALGYLVTFGIGTLVICWMLELEQGFERIVVVASAVMFVGGVSAALAFTGSPADLFQAMHDLMSAQMTHSENFYRMLGVQSSVANEIRDKMLSLTLRLAPALAAISAAFAVLVNLLLFWRRFGEARLPYKLFGDLVRWQLPEWVIWLFLATGFTLFVPVAPLKTVAIDSFLCVAAAYFCQGLAIVAFYFRVLAMPLAVRSIIYLITIIQPLFAAMVCAVGIFDLWVDFRRLKPRRPETGSADGFF